MISPTALHPGSSLRCSASNLRPSQGRAGPLAVHAPRTATGVPDLLGGATKPSLGWDGYASQATELPDSNLRHTAPETVALSPELQARFPRFTCKSPISQR